MNKKSFSYKLTTEQQDLVYEHLSKGNYEPAEVPYTRIAVKKDKARINLYNSGKLLVQGKDGADFVQFYLEPEILGSAELGYEAELDPSMSQPHMGVDESGKGDFFGPLVVAAAYVDESIVAKFREMDVRDSKAISSDAQARKMAQQIRDVLGPKRYVIMRIGIQKYNQLYLRMKSVNRMLAWGHATSIEDLLTKMPSCPRALCDQFGPKEQIERMLKPKGKAIIVDQRPKAESDPAVAAASILARAEFLDCLERMRTHYGIDVKKGASAQVRAAAEELVKKHGPMALLKSVKCHFKTTDQVLEACGYSRADLGPDGAVVSKSMRDFKKK